MIFPRTQSPNQLIPREKTAGHWTIDISPERKAFVSHQPIWSQSFLFANQGVERRRGQDLMKW